ncbi:MAG: prolipoprotein diacylglyceryl transferase [Chitinophagales bacterium]
MESIDLGFFQIPVYSLLLAIALLYGSFALYFFAYRENAPTDKMSGLLICSIVSSLVFARFAHVFLYDWNYFKTNLWEIPMVWEGGLASHGAAIGFIFGVVFHTRFWGNIWYWWIFDRMAIAIPFGAAIIRLGNFANSELYGKISNCAFCIVFENAGSLPRYPVQLMEAAAYLLLGLILYTLYFKKWKITHLGIYTGLMLTSINILRIALEFFKASDSVFWGLNTSQLLSIPFLFLGLLLMFAGYGKRLN